MTGFVHPLNAQPKTPEPAPCGTRSSVGPADDEAFVGALAAAAHHFATSGELQHLTPLVKRYPALVKTYLGNRGNPKNAFDGYTLLHRAASEGHSDVVAFLIENGAAIEADGGEGWTPLHVAVQRDRLEVVKLLVARGASLDRTTVAQPARAIGGGKNGPLWSPPTPAFSAGEIAQRWKATKVTEYLKSRDTQTRP